MQLGKYCFKYKFHLYYFNIPFNYWKVNSCIFLQLQHPISSGIKTVGINKILWKHLFLGYLVVYYYMRQTTSHTGVRTRRSRVSSSLCIGSLIFFSLIEFVNYCFCTCSYTFLKMTMKGTKISKHFNGRVLILLNCS